MEPVMGVCVVGLLSAGLVAVTCGFTLGSEVTQMGEVALVLIWVEASIAALSTLYLLFGTAGEIRRTEATCYPIPKEVEERLRQSMPLHGLANIPGPEHSYMHASYCVRCLVWRPRNSGSVHHCAVCQRCVKGFDHHCGVFGRCIVRRNMPCFFANIAMLLAGMVTAVMATVSSNSSMHPYTGV